MVQVLRIIVCTAFLVLIFNYVEGQNIDTIPEGSNPKKNTELDPNAIKAVDQQSLKTRYELIAAIGIYVGILALGFSIGWGWRWFYQRKNEKDIQKRENQLDEIEKHLLGLSSSLGITSIKDLENLSSLNKVKILPNIGAIVNTFKQIESNKIYQTFIQSLPPTASQDVAKTLNNGKGEVKYHRIITIAHPIDINFAVHSLNLELENNPVSNYIIEADKNIPKFRTYPNITIWENVATMITFPFAKYPFPLVKNDQAKDSFGVLIEDSSFADMMCEYFFKFSEIHQAAGANLSEVSRAKKKYWQNSKSDYLRSIGDAVFKEIMYDSHLEPKVDTLGIVGSVAKALNSKIENKPSNENFNDLDLLLVFDKVELETISKIEKILNDVLPRFSSDEIIFKIDLSACPVKEFTSENEFIVQILIDDLSTINGWSPLIKYDWYHSAFIRSGRFPFEEIKFMPSEVIVGRYGINDCLNAIKGNEEVCLHRWIADGKGDAIYFQDSRPVLKLEEFIKYSIIWCSINYGRCKNSLMEKDCINDSKKAIEWIIQNTKVIPTDTGHDIITLIERTLMKNTHKELAISYLEGLKEYIIDTHKIVL